MDQTQREDATPFIRNLKYMLIRIQIIYKERMKVAGKSESRYYNNKTIINTKNSNV